MSQAPLVRTAARVLSSLYLVCSVEVWAQVPASAPAGASAPDSGGSAVAAPEAAPTPAPTTAETAPASSPEPEPTPDAAAATPAEIAAKADVPAPVATPADAGAATDPDEDPAEAALTYPRLEFSARLMVGFEVDHRHPEGNQTLNGGNELSYGFFLRQARVGVDAYPHKRIKLALSVSLRQPEIRNAYANVRAKRWLQFRVGRFKRPFSRVELRSSGKLPFRERGIFNEELIEDSNWGDRALGAMVWGEIKAIDVNYYLGLMHPLNDPTTISFKQGADVVGRIEYEPGKVVSFGVNGAHKVLDDEHTPAIHMSAGGGDIRLRTEQLEVIAEFDVAQNANPPPVDVMTEPNRNPLAMGAIGYVAYEIPFTKSWSLQPIVLGEWVDTDVDFAQDETFRTVMGLNVLWKKYLKLMPQVELVQPLGTVSTRSQMARETYYLLVQVQYE